MLLFKVLFILAFSDFAICRGEHLRSFRGHKGDKDKSIEVHQTNLEKEHEEQSHVFQSSKTSPLFFTIEMRDENDHFQSERKQLTTTQRKSQQSVVSISFKSTCVERITVYLLYFPLSGDTLQGIMGYVDAGASPTFFADASSPTFYIYAYSKNNEWEGDIPVESLGGIKFERIESPTTTAVHTFDCIDSCQPNPNMQLSERESAWLKAHNDRRKKFHESFDTTFVPLNWSPELANSAQAYAEKLIQLNGCKIRHESQNLFGENLASNSATGSVPPLNPDKILERWTEEESTLPFVRNGHFRQVLWRATKFVGCGEGEKKISFQLSGGRTVEGTCHIQVCRYIKAGNCSVQSSNWMSKMLADFSGCGLQCPSEL